MRYPQWLFTILAMVLLTGEAVAQVDAPNPVMSHYRAYRQALAAGNLAAAESEAAAALEASVARDGDGGNTATLAINLAQARLALGRRNEAYDPALRAFNIASVGGSNVDPLMARLVLGRTQLTSDRESDGRPLLEDAIAQARTRPELRAETYAAAADLGRWLLAREQYVGALDAWTVAEELADTAEGDTAYARAEARLGKAAAQMARAMIGVIREQARPTDTRITTNAYSAFRDADEALAEAQALMAPYAHIPAEGGGLTLGQRTYAHVLAWRRLGRAFLQSRGLRPLPDFEMNTTAGIDPRQLCRMTIVAEPRPNFPPSASSIFAVGAVVVRFNVNEQGETTGVDIAASIPERWFREALERVTPQWRVERTGESPADCRYPPVFYQTWMFYFR
jgi:tetratricopeptide (TPR) repeat protein